MPTFNFSENFTMLERRVYMRTCRLLGRMLGIEHHDATINIMRVNLPDSSKALVERVCADQFIMLVDGSMPPNEVVHAIGHEMVHVDQYMRGDLVDVPGKRAVIWKGVHFDAVDPQVDPQGYLNQPWEKEAFDRHTILYHDVAVQLADVDRAAIMNEWLDSMIKSAVVIVLGYEGEDDADLS
jgi:hypothetical protein